MGRLAEKTAIEEIYPEARFNSKDFACLHVYHKSTFSATRALVLNTQGHPLAYFPYYLRTALTASNYQSRATHKPNS